VQHRCNRQGKLDGIIIQRVSPINRPGPYRGPDGRQQSRTFSRKFDAERWLKLSEAETLTGQWVDPPAGEKLFVPYAKEWIGYKRSTVGETTATNTETLLRARVLLEFGDETLKKITAPAVRSSPHSLASFRSSSEVRNS
jgi:hypothetical protein